MTAPPVPRLRCALAAASIVLIAELSIGCSGSGGGPTPTPATPAGTATLTATATFTFPSPTHTAVPPTPPDPTGWIEGMIGYPASGIPPELRVCAQNIVTRAETCTNDRLREARFAPATVGYELELPVGQYIVYAASGGVRGYYTELATCGLGPECDSHTILIVRVEQGVRRTRIDPVDFYGDWR